MNDVFVVVSGEDYELGFARGSYSDRDAAITAAKEKTAPVMKKARYWPYAQEGQYNSNDVVWADVVRCPLDAGKCFPVAYIREGEVVNIHDE